MKLELLALKLKKNLAAFFIGDVNETRVVTKRQKVYLSAVGDIFIFWTEGIFFFLHIRSQNLVNEIKNIKHDERKIKNEMQELFVLSWDVTRVK